MGAHAGRTCAGKARAGVRQVGRALSKVAEFLPKFLDCVIFATSAGGIITPWIRGEAMAERDMTAREDRFIGLCLVALPMIIVFLFILTTS
jgi:hypothetical protein